MAQFGSTSDVKQIYLPVPEGTPEADKPWVKMDISPFKTGDIVGIDQKESELAIGITMITARIIEWNNTDDKGTPLEITIDNVKNMNPEYFGFLASQIKAGDTLTDDEKKESLKSSQQEETTQTIPVTSL